jgi:large subunit ribosomal protein L17
VKRERLLRNLASHLFLHERIKTTLARGRELVRHAERLITLGKRGTPESHQRLLQRLNGTMVVDKVEGTLAERYANRSGGCVRLYRAGLREGDRAPQSIIELVECPFEIKSTFARFGQNEKLLTLSYPKPYQPSQRPLLK